MSTWLRGLLVVTLAVPVVVVTTASGAGAQDNGVGLTPLLGWSSWSFIRKAPTAAKIEAQADAVRGSGLADAGFRYVNVDDFWYQCPGSQGPNVDGFGRWVTDPVKFPPDGATDGIQVVADHVHGDGLKFGLYVTPGVSMQAVNQKSPILGTANTVDQIAVPTTAEKNYNCKGMVGIDYTRPGAQEFVNSWANEFASWGVDYVKIDGVGTSDVPDIQAWSNALRQTGRPIHLELSNSLRLTLDERKTQLSLWALAASPLILGTDLTNLDPTDLRLLTNGEVLAVDQDAIDASRIVNAPDQQVFAKTEPDGDAVVGLFNLSDSTQVVSTTAAALGLPAAGAYLVNDLWSHLPAETAGTIAANVAPHGVALYRVRPTRFAQFLPPSTTLAMPTCSHWIACTTPEALATTSA